MIKVGVIKAGYANYHSIMNAINHCGYDVKLIERANDNYDITHLILPGVGQFGAVVKNLRKKGLDDYINEHVEKGRALLGICVGFQLLFSESEESKGISGLNYFPEKIVNLNNKVRTVPNIGWRKVKNNKSSLFKKNNKRLENNFYFAHSFFLPNKNKKEFISSIKLEKTKIVIAVEKNNIMGVQFHPEKSSSYGIELLKNFCSYSI